MERDLINRDRDIQRQWQEYRIRHARYNTRYKEFKLDGKGPKYLKVENRDAINKGEDIRALVKLRWKLRER